MPGCIGRPGVVIRPERKAAGLRRWITGVSTVLALQGFAAACDYPFGPDGGEVLPTLAGIGLADLGRGGIGNIGNDSGIVWLWGTPSDTSFRLQRNQRVPARLVSSSGDEEQVGLYRLECPAREGGYVFSCFNFLILFAEGYDMAEIERRVAAIGGRFALRTSSFASIVIFEPDATMRRAREAGSWPGVAYPWFPTRACDPFGCSSLAHELTLPVRLDYGPPIPGDGTLQVTPGDTIHYSYTQPTGQTLEASLHVQ